MSKRDIICDHIRNVDIFQLETRFKEDDTKWNQYDEYQSWFYVLLNESFKSVNYSLEHNDKCRKIFRIIFKRLKHDNINVAYGINNLDIKLSLSGRQD